jgi:hypothetical protein
MPAPPARRLPEAAAPPALSAVLAIAGAASRRSPAAESGFDRRLAREQRADARERRMLEEEAEGGKRKRR